MKRLTVLTTVDGVTGFGMHGMQIVRDLTTLTGAHVSVRPLAQWEAFGAKIPEDIRARFVNCPQPEEWEILLHPPNFCPTPKKKTLYTTMWESTKLPPGAVSLLNRAEVVVVPCQWNASCFSACGVKVPIRVVPLGIKQDVFRFRHKPPTDVTVFGTAGRMAHGGIRKGINQVIEIWRKTFPVRRDVKLKVKCFPDCDVRWAKHDDRIEVTQAYLSEEQMAEWLASLDVFVSAARAEGWGLIQHQAMNVGRPVASVAFGGVTEFFGRHCGHVIPHRIAPATGSYAGCGHWAEPIEHEFSDLLHRIHKQPEKNIELGSAAVASVAPFSWIESHRKLLAVLQEFGAL